jgi:16S rRNA (adenine1518-N6/adenine1519-N6)-dimethyltransferase
MTARAAWSEFRAQLEARGFRPSKRLGQNFLRDGNMARAIVRDAGVQRGDFVLEVGPGCGFLTVHLLELGVRLLAIEIDSRLAEVTRGFVGAAKDFELLEGDALAGKHGLAPELVSRLPTTGDWHLVSNLPYSAGTPIVVLLSRLAHPPASMTVLVQRELAERLAATPGTKAWGALSARLQLGYDIEPLRTVSAELFWPRPKVASRVVRLTLRERLSDEHWSALDRLLECLFRERRKTLAAILSGPFGGREKALERLAERGLSASARPGELGTAELLDLARDWPA